MKQLEGLKVATAKGKLQLHTTLDHQVAVI
jgi:hypothetical protein